MAAAEKEAIGGEVFNLGSGKRIVLNDVIKILHRIFWDISKFSTNLTRWAM